VEERATRSMFAPFGGAPYACPLYKYAARTDRYFVFR
jgi:hypothetical protein